jgi:hypothetical protein
MRDLKKYLSITGAVLFSLLISSHLVMSQNNMTLEELFVNANVIFYAKIISSETHVSNLDGYIYTLTKLKVLDQIKGNLGSDEYSFDQRGGRIGNSGTWVSSSVAIPSSGDVILFLQNKPQMEGNPLWPISAWGDGSEGKIPIKADQLVDAQRFVDVLKKALTDSTAIPAFYEDIRKEEEAKIESSKHAYPKAINFQVGDPSNIPEDIRKKGQQKIDSILANEARKNERRRMIDSLNQNQSNQSVRRTEGGAPLPFIQN